MKYAVVMLSLLATMALAEETKKPDPVTHAWQVIDEASKSGDAAKRREMVTAASLGGPRDKVFAFLGAAVSDKELEVRLAACASLASLKDKRSIPPLRRALADPTPEWRSAPRRRSGFWATRRAGKCCFRCWAEARPPAPATSPSRAGRR